MHFLRSLLVAFAFAVAFPRSLCICIPAPARASNICISKAPRITHSNTNTLFSVGTQAIALDNTIKSRALQRRFEQAKGEADMMHADAGLLGGRSTVILMLHPFLSCVTAIVVHITVFFVS